MNFDPLINPRALTIIRNPSQSLASSTIDTQVLQQALQRDLLCQACFNNGRSFLFFPVENTRGGNFQEQQAPPSIEGLGITSFLLHPLCLDCSRICSRCVLTIAGREQFGLNGASFNEIPNSLQFLMEV